VLTATDGKNALSVVAERGEERFDLLFTDIVMPLVDGKELSYRIRASHPEMKILFTSAYTENALIHQSLLDPGFALLQKPFTPSALAKKIRETLEQPVIAQPELAEKSFECANKSKTAMLPRN
jgi:CheY-like chemotaxis protein